MSIINTKYQLVALFLAGYLTKNNECCMKKSIAVRHTVGGVIVCDMSFREGPVHDAMAGRLLSGSSEIQKNIIAAMLGPGARKG